MRWEKRGLIYNTNGQYPWAKTAAMIPTPEVLEDRIRFYITVCDMHGIGRITFFETDLNDFSKILYNRETPLFEIGRPGTFDENGCLVTSVVNVNGVKYLYYVGFEIGTRIRYRLLTGMALSEDQGKTFQKVSQTPVLERSEHELYFRGGPFVFYEKGLFRMWYVAGSSWITIDGKEMPVYTIRYIESTDGIHWPTEGKECIAIESDREHGFGRPYVVKDGDIYRMFYSIRLKHLGYRMGYAESKDGINWVRKDVEMNLDVSPNGWDSEIVCYPAVVKVKDKICLFYNGNGFGKTGFGWAELQSW